MSVSRSIRSEQWLCFTVGFSFDKSTRRTGFHHRLESASYRVIFFLCVLLSVLSYGGSSLSQVPPSSFDETVSSNDGITSGGLVERIPEHYVKRYNHWKTTFLSAPLGRELWSKYAANPSFH